MEKTKNSLKESVENEPTKNEIVVPSKEDTPKFPYPQRLRKFSLMANSIFQEAPYQHSIF